MIDYLRTPHVSVQGGAMAEGVGNSPWDIIVNISGKSTDHRQ